MGIVSGVFVFGILVFVHELGHFLFAKIFKVYVEKFSIGFGPSLFSKKWGETVYSISAIPLGGYVKMYGEDPTAEISPEMKEKAFSHKSLWKRSIIVFAGPLFNIFLAIKLFAVINFFGTPMLLPVIKTVQPDMPAIEAGLAGGDRVVAIDGKEIRYWEEMSSIIKKNPGKSLSFSVKRGDKLLSFTVTPRLSESKNIFGEKIQIGLVGIVPDNQIVTVSHGFFESIILGFKKSYEVLELTVLGIIKIFQKVVPADSIGGPIMIFQMAKETSSMGVNSLLAFVAVISINLGVLNLLPVPVLDGGHLMFFAIEGITRRPVSLKIREIANMVGIGLLLALMVFAFYNDIMRMVQH